MRSAPAAAGSVLAFAFTLVVAACGDDRPPPLGDPTFVVDSGKPPSLDAGPTAPTCDLGPDYGVCACTEVKLITDAPNLYFVLDRSGSMAEGNKWTTVREVIVKTVTALGPRVNVGAAVYPSDAVCGTGKEVLAVRPGDAPAGVFGPTADALATATSLPVLGGTPTSATLASLTPRITSLQGKTVVILATDGAPNCNASATCGVDECLTNLEAQPGCPIGGPPNCCAPNQIDGPTLCLDKSATLAAIDGLFAKGVPTYVIGVPGSGPYASLLDAMATHGGTARGASPQYYRVDSTDASAFASALAAIAAKVTASCTFTLDSVPEPSKLNVFLDGIVLPQDPNNGWKLDGTTVEIVGDACKKLQSGDILSVRVVAGCPTVVPK
jgi:hypothetical protein